MQTAILIVAVLLTVVAPRDPTARVHDFANLLTAEQRASLEDLSRAVERQTTAQLAIVTVPSLRGQTVEAYANELFNEWGIGQKEVNNGVLLLVAPTERRMRIEVGYGIEPLLTDSLCGEIRDQAIIPRFKANDYAGGILAGAQRLAAVLQSDPAAARGDPNSGPILARRQRRNALWATGTAAFAAAGLLVLGILTAVRRLYSTPTFFAVTAASATLLGIAAYFTFHAPAREQPLAWLGGAAFASVAGWCLNLVRYRRFGPHGCSKCGTRLELLSEQDDDPKLTPVQRLEEKIGSVDYDVWICPACLNQDTERYLKRFSGFTECAKCGALRVQRRRAGRDHPRHDVEQWIGPRRRSLCELQLQDRPPHRAADDSGILWRQRLVLWRRWRRRWGWWRLRRRIERGRRRLGRLVTMYFTYAAAILCAILVVWYFLTYNSLITCRNAVDQSWSHIEVELQRRLDLIGNLVEVVKGYAKHESETFQQVAALRTQTRPFGDAATANSVSPQLNRSIGQLIALAESYPQLLADKSFLNLQHELSDTEDRIAERRHAYNQTVNNYLNQLMSVPSNVVADFHCMQPRAFFDVPDAEVEQPPQIKFS